MSVREIVMKSLAETVAESSSLHFPDSIPDSTLLDEFHLDSLDFAHLLSRIENELKSGPLLFSDVTVYPRTIGDLINNFEMQFPDQK